MTTIAELIKQYEVDPTAVPVPQPNLQCDGVTIKAELGVLDLTLVAKDPCFKAIPGITDPVPIQLGIQSVTDEFNLVFGFAFGPEDLEAMAAFFLYVAKQARTVRGM